MTELRKHVRINDAVFVSYRELKGYLVSSSHSRNISKDGICMPLQHKFDPGVILALKIYIVEWDMTIKAVGEVVWLRETKDRNYTFLAGIKFIEFPQEEYGKLCRYLNKFKK